MFTTNQTEILAQKLKTIFDRTQVSYNEASRVLSINKKSLTLPQNPKQQIFSRQYLSR